MEDIDRNAVLEALGPRAMHVMEVCDRLGLPRRSKQDLLDVLERLRDQGMAKELPGQRFRRAEPKQGRGPHGSKAPPAEVTGRLQMHARGFGFVAPEDGSDDVFVPPDSNGPAMHGDRVRLHVQKSPKGREGHVVEVIARALKRITGTVQQRDGERWFIPDDLRLPRPMPLENAKSTKADEDTTVIAEIVSYPQSGRQLPTVAVREVLGMAGVATVEVEKLKLRDGVVEPFPANVVEEAQKVPKHVLPAEADAREDLRLLDLVTIDPPDARDHDDAVWAERRPEGGYRVVVAIADVSHYVAEGTALDAEALARGVSIYLPDRAIPMLPKEISSGMASLVPNEDRLTLAVDVKLSKDGVIEGFRYVEGIMRSRARLTYGSYAEALGWTSDPPPMPEAHSRRPLLELLAEVSGKLRALRRARGAIEFDLPEPRVLLEEETGEPLDVYRSREDPGIRRAYAVVEDLMLLANEVVAADLSARKVPAIYRVHGKPDPKKVASFVELAQSLGNKVDEDAVTDPKALSAFLKSIEGTPSAGPLGHLLLRAMQQAIYDVKDIGHFALAAEHYLHFTSPIRRYPDLCVHRVVRSVIHGERSARKHSVDELKAAALESSRLERRAMVLERDTIDLYRCLLMQSRVGEEFAATVSGIAEHGVYASLASPFADVVLPFERMPGHFEANPLGTDASDPLTGLVFSLGDPVEVRIENVSLERREIQGVPAEFADTVPQRRERGRGHFPRFESQRQSPGKGKQGGGQGKARRSFKKQADNRGKGDNRGRPGKPAAKPGKPSGKPGKKGSGGRNKGRR